MLLLADDQTGVYDQGWRELSYATGVVSERTVMRALGYLRDAGLVEPLPRIPGQFRAYRLHP
jgi:DNA-binding transcriptional ArsR family regulator